MNKFFDDLKWTFKLFAITLTLPVVGTAMYLLGWILNLTVVGFSEAMYGLWIDYYFTGKILDVDSWRIHLVLFIISYFIIRFGSK